MRRKPITCSQRSTKPTSFGSLAHLPEAQRDKIILDNLLVHKKTIAEVADEFRIDDDTLRRHARGVLKCTRVRKWQRPLLTREMKSERLALARFMYQNANMHKAILFTDECTIKIGTKPGANGEHVWVSVHNMHDPQRYEACRGDRIRVDISGGISVFGGRTEVTVLTGTSNRSNYLSIARDVYLPHIMRHRHEHGRDLVFQCDKGPYHVDVYDEFIRVPILHWVPNSPDLNIIEDVWRNLKARIRKRLHEIATADDLIRVIGEEWPIVTSEAAIAKLFVEQRRRLACVIAADGCNRYHQA